MIFIMNNSLQKKELNRIRFLYAILLCLLVITSISSVQASDKSYAAMTNCTEPTACTPEIITNDFDGCETFVFSTAASNTCNGTKAFSVPDRALVDNNLFSFSVLSTGTLSHCLDLTGITSNIPAGANIKGIQASVRGRSNTTGAVTDANVQLLKAGTAVGDNKAIGTPWTNIVTTFTYGGPTDLWGTTWNVADFSDPGFGVRFQAEHVASNNRQAQVYYVEVDICYDVMSGNPGDACSIATASDIAGTVWEDENFNGILDETNPNGVGGITVTASDCSGNSFSSCTDVNGNYIISGLTADTTYRVDFELPIGSCWSNPSFAGPNNSTVIQFKTPGNCASLGLTGEITAPKFLVTNCYVQGAVDSIGPFNVTDVAIRWSYDNTGITTLDKTLISHKSQIGSTWGIAWDSLNGLMYTAPFLKRHIGIPDHDGDGNADLDVIYSINPNSFGANSATVWLDLGALGVDAGTIPSDQTRALGNESSKFNDPTTYNQVGKVGWGDLDISDDYSTLYAVNLYDRKLYSIDIATKTINGSFAVPDPCGTDGENRPFGLKYYDGNVYLGVTCDASTSQLVADLEAFVYEFDGATFTEVLNIPLDYDKGSTGISLAASTTWHPWDVSTTTLPGYIFTNANIGDIHVYEQPLLSDIEFDDNGDMTISFLDLGPHRQGWRNYGLSGTTNTSFLCGGDVLKACLTGTSFTLESNASCGGVTTGPATGGPASPHSGPDNNFGPDGGEFYFGDGYYQSQFSRYGHSETVVGGMAVNKGTGEIAINMFDPVDDGPLNNNGVAFLDWATGGKTRGFRIATGESKGAALGDIEIVHGISPIEIGNRVWLDKDEDGIQDGCEVGIAGINVSIYADNGGCCNAPDLLGMLTTDANGYYLFNDSILAVLMGAPSDTTGILKSNATYHIVYGDANQYNGSTDILTAGSDYFTLTQLDAVDGSHFDSDLIDSDATEGSNGMVYLTINTGSAGESNHTYSLGLIPSGPPPLSVVGNRIWIDENADGIQEAGEPGVPNVVVELQDDFCTPGVDCPTTITDADGGYIFEEVLPGDYTVVVLSNVPTELIPIFDEDSGTTGPDMSTTVTVTPNEYVTADFGYNYTTKADTDSPSLVTAPGALGNRIWNDADGDGIQDPGESGIPNITVELWTDANLDGTYTPSGITTMTDEYGKYIFTGLTPGAYVVNVVEAGISGAGFVTAPTGDPDADATNTSDPIMIAPGDVWLGGNFGYQSAGTPADIGSTVFVDVDADGSFNAANDLPLEGVTVALVKDTDGNGIWDVGEPIIATTETAADGTYLFPDLADDDYVVVVTDVENIINDLTNTVDPDGNNDAYSGVSLNGVDELAENFGYVPTDHTASKGFIGNMVFLDADGGGDFDPMEPGIEGVIIELLDANSIAVLATTMTNENGMYYFGNLDDGDYKVKLDATSIPTGLATSFDPDGSAPADNEGGTVTIAGGSNDLDQDFGFKATIPYSITGTIWEDINAEGTLDGAEANRFEDITIDLLDTNGNIISTTTTDVNGDYSFMQIPEGTYTVKVTDVQDNLKGHWHSLGTDSESNSVSVMVSGVNLTDIDFGYYQQGSAIGNMVWLDYNANDQQDVGEPGLPNAKLTLEIDYNNDGIFDVSVVTISDIDGSYSFKGLLLDEDYNGITASPDYNLVVTLTDPDMAAAYLVNTADQAGGNDLLDSDAHTGHTVTLIQGQENIDNNADASLEATEGSNDFGYTFDCTNPTVQYAMTDDGSDPSIANQTTDFFATTVSSNALQAHATQVQLNGSIQSWTYCEINGWNYYYNPQDPDEYLFAIEHGTNTTEIEYVEIRVDDNATDRHVNDATDATFVMVRDWFVKTKDDAPLTGNVNIRFYFPPSEYKEMLDAAKAQAASWGVSNPDESMVQWFKKPSFDPDADVNSTNSILAPFDITSMRNAASDSNGNNTALAAPIVENNTNHIQFNGITGFSGGTAMIHINRSALPVQLSRFAAIPIGCNVKIEWTSETEENFSHYELERSIDGNNFEFVSSMVARGGIEKQNYNYLDKEALPIGFYRLKMVDLDQSIEYSDIRSVTTDCSKKFDMVLYPNPIKVGDIINVKFYTRSAQANLTLVDPLGKVLKMIPLNDLVRDEWNTIIMGLSELSSGSYYIRLDAEGDQISKQFSILE